MYESVETIEFVKGQQYTNRKGTYIILDIQPQSIQVRYEDGLEETLDATIQRRISPQHQHMRQTRQATRDQERDRERGLFDPASSHRHPDRQRQPHSTERKVSARSRSHAVGPVDQDRLRSRQHGGIGHGAL